MTFINVPLEYSTWSNSCLSQLISRHILLYLSPYTCVTSWLRIMVRSNLFMNVGVFVMQTLTMLDDSSFTVFLRQLNTNLIEFYQLFLPWHWFLRRLFRRTLTSYFVCRMCRFRVYIFMCLCVCVRDFDFIFAIFIQMNCYYYNQVVLHFIISL